MVLLIACANVANLLLARAVACRGQTAVRIAIGATRRRIVAEALGETVPLALARGLVGLALAMGAARLLVGLAFRNSGFVRVATAPSVTVLAFAVAASLVTAMLAAATPAWLAASTDPLDALRGGHRSSGSRTTLVILEMTLSVVLVAASIMLVRSLAKLQQQDLGYGV